MKIVISAFLLFLVASCSVDSPEKPVKSKPVVPEMVLVPVPQVPIPEVAK